MTYRITQALCVGNDSPTDRFVGVSGTSVGSPWTFDTNATGTGTNSSTMTLTEAQGNQLSSGNWYYGYNTAANASGETRGQIMATQMN